MALTEVTDATEASVHLGEAAALALTLLGAPGLTIAATTTTASTTDPAALSAQAAMTVVAAKFRAHPSATICERVCVR